MRLVVAHGRTLVMAAIASAIVVTLMMTLMARFAMAVMTALPAAVAVAMLMIMALRALLPIVAHLLSFMPARLLAITTRVLWTFAAGAPITTRPAVAMARGARTTCR